MPTRKRKASSTSTRAKKKGPPPSPSSKVVDLFVVYPPEDLVPPKKGQDISKRIAKLPNTYIPEYRLHGKGK